MVSAIDLFNAATADFIIGWWMRDIMHSLRKLLSKNRVRIEDGEVEG